MRRCSASPSAVAASARPIVLARPSGRRSRRPITVSRTPLRAGLSISFAGRAQQRHQRRSLPPAAGASCRWRTRRASACRRPGSGAASTTRRIASTPASCPREPRQAAARRPASVAVHDDADMQQSAFSSESTLHCKVSWQKKGARSGAAGCAAGPTAASSLPAALAASRTSLFEHREIVEEAAAAGLVRRQTGVRAVALVALGDFDQPGLLQHLQMTAEIAVGQAAELLEIGEGRGPSDAPSAR